MRHARDRRQAPPFPKVARQGSCCASAAGYSGAMPHGSEAVVEAAAAEKTVNELRVDAAAPEATPPPPPPAAPAATDAPAAAAAQEPDAAAAAADAAPPAPAPEAVDDKPARGGRPRRGRPRGPRERKDGPRSGARPGGAGRTIWIGAAHRSLKVCHEILGAALPDAVRGFPVTVHAMYEDNVNTACASSASVSHSRAYAARRRQGRGHRRGPPPRQGPAADDAPAFAASVALRSRTPPAVPQVLPRQPQRALVPAGPRRLRGPGAARRRGRADRRVVDGLQGPRRRRREPPAGQQGHEPPRHRQEGRLGGHARRRRRARVHRRGRPRCDARADAASAVFSRAATRRS